MFCSETRIIIDLNRALCSISTDVYSVLDWDALCSGPIPFSMHSQSWQSQPFRGLNFFSFHTRGNSSICLPLFLFQSACGAQLHPFGRISLFFMNEWYRAMCVHHACFIQSSVFGQLVWLHPSYCLFDDLISFVYPPRTRTLSVLHGSSGLAFVTPPSCFPYGCSSTQSHWQCTSLSFPLFSPTLEITMLVSSSSEKVLGHLLILFCFFFIV